jgi:hypothetical protein
MSEQATSSISLYWHRETRAEAYARRARLFAENVEELRKAGRVADAAEAASLQAAGPAAFAPSSPGCYEADEQMDQAVSALAVRQFTAAAGVLESAVCVYHQAGKSRHWDYADALWDFGYALAYAAGRRFSQALQQMGRAACLFRQQGRILDWVRCRVAMLAVTTMAGLGGPSSQRIRRIEVVCDEFQFTTDLFQLRRFLFEQLVTSGQFDEAKAMVPDIVALGEVLDGDAVEQARSLCEQIQPESVLKNLAKRLVHRVVPDTASACATIANWDPRLGSADQITLVLRGLTWARRLKYPLDVPRAKRAILQIELALRLTDQHDQDAVARLVELAVTTDSSVVEYLERQTFGWCPASKRQALIQVLSQIASKGKDGAVLPAFARVMIQQAVDLATRGLHTRAHVCLQAASRIGFSRDWLLAEIDRLDTSRLPSEVVTSIRRQVAGGNPV